jgi:hypothetical protein
MATHVSTSLISQRILLIKLLKTQILLFKLHKRSLAFTWYIAMVFLILRPKVTTYKKPQYKARL